MRRIVTVIALALCAAAVAGTAPANSIPEPTYDTAVVDGLYAEWNLTEDFFCDMYRDGDPAQPLTARIYLRYDCETGTMFVLVLTEPGVSVVESPYDAWIQVVGRIGRVFDGDPYNDGVPSDFAWANGGYEGKFPIFEGIHELVFHLLVTDEGQERTSATAGYPDQGCPVSIDCGVVPAATATWGRIKQTYR